MTIKNNFLRLVVDRAREGDLNMAVDEAIAMGGRPTLRFYTWSRPWITIGYFQKWGELNLPFLKEKGISFVRRLTGGKGVYHHNELTYSFIVPENFLPSKVIDSYKMISQGLLRGLGILGIQADLEASPQRGAADPNCFVTPSWYEVITRGRKIVGSAQVRRKGMIIQQGSILLSGEKEIFSQCFIKKEKSLRPLENHLTAVKEELGHCPEQEELIRAFSRGFQEALPFTFRESLLDEEEEKVAKELREEKYSKDRWNKRR